MLDNFNTLISKYKGWISFDLIKDKKYFTSGGSCDIYKGIYNSENIILKIFDSKNYHYENGVLEDLLNELEIYNLLENTKKDQLCHCYGYSFSNFNNGYQTYLILKDYGGQGDLCDIIKNEKYWFKYNNNLNLNDYYYKFRDTEWKYNMNRNFKLQCTKSLCESIKQLHDNNIVHCDLKPNNILFINDKIIIIDFGASRFLDKEKVIITEEDMGTLGYMCEELQFGICSEKSDIYSLGICILELWVGEIWQEGNNYKECRKEALNSLKYLESKEKELSKIIKKCILKDTKKRPYIQTVIKNLSKIV